MTNNRDRQVYTDPTSGLSYYKKTTVTGTRYRQYIPPANQTQNNNMYRSPYEGADLNALTGWANQAIQQPGARDNQFLQTFMGNYNNLAAQEQQKQDAQRAWVSALETQNAAKINQDIQNASIERARLDMAVKGVTPQQRASLERDYGTSDPKQLAVIAQAITDALTNAKDTGGGLALSSLMDHLATQRSVTTSSGVAAQKSEAERQHELAKNKFSWGQWALRSVTNPMTYATFGLAALGDAGHGIVSGENGWYGRQGNEIAGTAMKGLGIAGDLLQPAMKPFYAWEYSQLHGGTLGDQFRAGMAGVYNDVPGIGDNIARTISTKEGAAATFATDTREEREALKKAGQLLGWGDYWLGYGGDLRGEAMRRYEKEWDTWAGGSIKKFNPYYSSALKDPHGIVHTMFTGASDAVFTTLQDPTIYIGAAGAHSFYEFAIKNVPQELEGEALNAATRAAAASYITESRAGQFALEKATAQVTEALTKYEGAFSDRLIAKLLSVRGEVGRETVANLRRAVLERGDSAGTQAVREALVEEFASGRWQVHGKWLRRAMNAMNSLEAAEASRVGGKTIFFAKMVNGLQSGRLRYVTGLLGATRSWRSGMSNALEAAYRATDKSLTLGEFMRFSAEAGPEHSAVLRELVATGRPTNWTLDTTLGDLLHVEQASPGLGGAHAPVFMLTEDEAQAFMTYGIMPDYLTQRNSAMLGQTVGEAYGAPTATGRLMPVRIGDISDPTSMEFLVSDEAGRMLWVGEEDTREYYDRQFAQVLARYNVIEDPEELTKALKQIRRNGIQAPQPVHVASVAQKNAVPEVLNRAIAKFEALGLSSNQFSHNFQLYQAATRDDVLAAIDTFVKDGVERARTATGATRPLRDLIASAGQNARSHGFQFSRGLEDYGNATRGELLSAKDRAMNGIGIKSNGNNKINRMMSDLITDALNGKPGALDPGRLLYLFQEMGDSESLFGKYMWKELEAEHVARYGKKIRAISDLNVPEPIIHTVEDEAGSLKSQSYRAAAARVEASGFPRPDLQEVKLTWQGMVDHLNEAGAVPRAVEDGYPAIPWDPQRVGDLTKVPSHMLGDAELYAALDRLKQNAAKWQEQLIPMFEEEFNKITTAIRRGNNAANNGRRYQFLKIIEELLAPRSEADGAQVAGRVLADYVEQFNRTLATNQRLQDEWYARVEQEVMYQQEVARGLGKGVYEEPTAHGYHPDPTGRYPTRHFDFRTKKWTALVKDSEGTTLRDPAGAPTLDFIDSLPTRADVVREAGATTAQQRSTIREVSRLTSEEKWQQVGEWGDANLHVNLLTEDVEVSDSAVENFNEIFGDGEFPAQTIDEEAAQPLHEQLAAFDNRLANASGQAKLAYTADPTPENMRHLDRILRTQQIVRRVTRSLTEGENPFLLPERIAEEGQWTLEEFGAVISALSANLNDTAQYSMYSIIVDELFPKLLSMNGDVDSLMTLYVKPSNAVVARNFNQEIVRKRIPQSATKTIDWLLPEGVGKTAVRPAADVQAVGDWLKSAVQTLPESDVNGLPRLAYAADSLLKDTGFSNDVFDTILTQTKLKGDVGWSVPKAAPIADELEKQAPRINNMFATARALAEELDIPGLEGLLDEIRQDFSVERLSTMLAPSRLQAMEDLATLDHLLSVLKGERGAEAAHEAAWYLNSSYTGGAIRFRNGVAEPVSLAEAEKTAERLGEAHHWADANQRALYTGIKLPEVMEHLRTIKNLADMGNTRINSDFIDVIMAEAERRAANPKAKGLLPLWKLAAFTDAVTHDYSAIDELMRVYNTSLSRAQLWNDTQAILNSYIENTSLWERIRRGAAEMALKSLQRAPDLMYYNLATNRNVQASHIEAFITELAAALPFHPDELAVIRSRAVDIAERVSRGGSEEEIQHLLGDMYHSLFRKFGVSEEGYQSWRETMTQVYKAEAAEAGRPVRPGTIQLPGYTQNDIDMLAAGNVREVDGGVVAEAPAIDMPQVTSQRRTSVRAYSPEEIINGINRELKAAGRWSRAEHPIQSVQLWMDDARIVHITGAEGEGAKKFFMNAKGKYHALFGLWKTMVTSRLYMGPLMAGGSLIDSYRNDGKLDSGEIWRAIALGVTGSVLGFERYRTRMSIINRITAMLAGGYTPGVNVPGITEFYSRYARQIFGDGLHVLAPSPGGPGWWNARQRVLRGMTDDWVLLQSGDKMFVEEYSRILNYQLRPEEDQVVEIYLRHFANGAVNKSVADDEVRRFLGTEEGRLWAQRAHWTTASPQEAVDTTYNMVAVYAGRQEVASARLAATGFREADRISAEQIAMWQESGLLAPVIHAQKSTSVFTSPKAAFDAWKRYFAEAAYGSANAPGYRAALKAAYYDRMTNSFMIGGMARDRAEELADELSTHQVNRILFRHDNATIAARKVDWIAPFTAHRQFTAYMWTRLAAEKVMYNTSEAMFLTKSAALAFNALKEDGGVLKKDDFGNYRFVVPGSAQLSSLLGAPNEFELDASINGFMAITSEMSIESGNGLPVWAAAGAQAVPHPGGPAWTLVSTGLAKMFPEFMDPETTPLPKGLYEYLWPMGPTGGLLGGADAQVWGALMGTAGPWEMINEQGVQYVNRLQVQIIKEQIAEYKRANGAKADPAWFPSKEETRKKLLAALQAWTMTRMLFPSAARWRFKDSDTAQERFATYRQWSPQLTTSEAKRQWLRRHPEDFPWLSLSSTESKKKKSTFAQWASNDQFTGDYANFQFDLFTGQTAYKTPEELKADVEHLAKQSEYYTRFDALPSNPIDREEALAELDKEFPEEAKFFRDRGLMLEDLAVILTTYQPGPAQTRAIDRFRQQNNLSFETYNKYAQRIYSSIKNDPEHQYRYNYYTTARSSWEVYDAVVGYGEDIIDPMTQQLVPSVVAKVAQLQPVEQIRFWTAALVDMWGANTKNQMVNYDPNSAMSLDALFRQQRGEVYGNVKYQELMRPLAPNFSRDKSYSDELIAKAENGRSILAGIGDKIAHLSEQIDAAAKRKDFRAVGQLAKERAALYEEKKAVHNYLWADKSMSADLHDAIRELTYLQNIGADKKTINGAEAKVRNLYLHAPLEHADEEATYMARNAKGQKAYVADLVNRLNMSPDDGKASSLLRRDGIQVPARLTWDFLTDFQKSLLSGMPPQQIQAWKDQAKLKPTGSGGGSKSIAQSEIQYAYAMLKQFSQRGNMPKPKDYDAYLALPNNPILRNQFLAQHPDVAEYVRKGGLANMPPVIRAIVQDIMIRNGKWDGEEKSIHEITDLAFAREQLQRYTRRRQGEQAPQAFDLWVNMPEGAEKQDYLKKHPEIQDWVQRGPMANMPEMYRDVVRDIMYRYNEWTANSASDGMGQLMRKYLATPTYARSAFLAENPSLAAYLMMSKSPEEQAMAAKMDGYFAIPDVEARKTYLQVNPDVQQYMLTARTKRYERFLNQVAQYMGQNPELFQKYLDQQQVVMGDLLKKFAEPHLVQEAPWLGYPQDVKNTSEGGRVRATR